MDLAKIKVRLIYQTNQWLCVMRVYLFILFIWGFTSLSTLYRSYHDRQICGQSKLLHTVGQGSVL